MKKKKKLAKVLIPLLVFLVIVNTISIVSLFSEVEFYKQKQNLNNEIDQKFTKHSVQHTSASTSYESTVPTNTSAYPFRFYIYELPRSLNKDILEYCHNYLDRNCFNFSLYGMGREIVSNRFTDGSISICGTNQFNLEPIIHEKLKRNPLRTRNPEKADLFYVPAYIGLLCICQNDKASKMVQTLKDFLTNSSYFSTGKPHFSTASKIEKEMESSNCPYLFQSFTNKITYITIEKQKMSYGLDTVWPYSIMHKNSIIVAPYPSYGHFQQSKEIDLSTVPIHDRDVFILLPAGEHPSSHQRLKIMNQFDIKTKLPYSRFKMCHVNRTNTMVLFYTKECDYSISKSLFTWMQHSVFCLQPPGDSPSRKSFYDSIISGCIPVILTVDGHNPYAFQEFLDYSTFTISIEVDKILEEGHNIYNLLQDVSTIQIQTMHEKIRKIAKYMQYSIPSHKRERENDALQLIFHKLANKFKLPYDKQLQGIN
ncbi:MUR3 [Mytilus edulis]|uniref:MUR3 n=1 Tax=Mytilus edulis TaxID=6550 RepID=A0A8S3SEK3_MYTED|nr:MUR3 [Mytilus edulis]